MITKADLHIHSCLSPCGSLESSPRRIAEALSEKAVGLAALTDHNSTRNCPAFRTACTREGITPVYGIEVTSFEEAHILALFEELDAAVGFGDLVYDLLADIPNRPELFGDQPVVDDEEVVLDFVEKNLVGAVALSVNDLVSRIHEYDGLVIPAHINRPMMSLYSQLGFLPDLPFDAVEATTPLPPEETRDYTLICNSDAHYLDNIAGRSFTFEGSTLGDLRNALANGAVELQF